MLEVNTVEWRIKWKLASPTVKPADSVTFLMCASSCFDKSNHASSSQFEVAGFRFGVGSFLYHGNYMYVAYMTSDADLNQAETFAFIKFLPDRIRVQKKYQSRFVTDFPHTYTFLGFEDITIDGHKHEKCPKLQIEDSDYYHNGFEIVWFKKGYGVVKRQLPDHRIEELIKI